MTIYHYNKCVREKVYTKSGELIREKKFNISFEQIGWEEIDFDRFPKFSKIMGYCLIGEVEKINGRWILKKEKNKFISLFFL